MNRTLLIGPNRGSGAEAMKHMSQFFESGPDLPCRALFFNTGRRQSTNLAEKLGCEMYEESGCELDNKFQASNVPGLYIAGDASRDVLQAIVAASEGAEAAIAINTALMTEDPQ